MNEIKIKVKFKRGLCIKSGIDLVSGDYNSTKLTFDFDIEDGQKIFEMKAPDGSLVFVDEIINNEIILARFDENGQAHSIFNQNGNYTFEISLYKENSKLTSASNYLKIKPEQVIIEDEITEVYLPIFDKLMNELQDLISQTSVGNVDDVKVDGVSVVNNKIANINLRQTIIDILIEKGLIKSEELTESQIKAIDEIVAIANEELTIEYDDEVLNVDFAIEDDNLIVTNNVTGLDFNINENGEMEAIY